MTFLLQASLPPQSIPNAGTALLLTGMLPIGLSRSTVQFLCVECKQTLNAFFVCHFSLCLQHYFKLVYSRSPISTVDPNMLSQIYTISSVLECFAYALCASTVTGLSVVGG